MTDSKKPRALKLAKLPDRKPVKMTISLSAELAAQLNTYAATYREVYGEDEGAAALIPFMLMSFLESDRAFRRSHRLSEAAAKLSRARKTG